VKDPLLDPIDPLHAWSIEAREHIRMHAKVLQAKAAEWTPRPCPPVESPLPERNKVAALAPKNARSW